MRWLECERTRRWNPLIYCRSENGKETENERLARQHAQPGEKALALRDRIAEPLRRRDPDEREDRDHPEIVRDGRPLVGPEKCAIECAAHASVCRHRFVVE